MNVVETGSFSAASERMGLSRAAVSKYVSQLENHLGGRLLNRSTRHVSITEVGQLYYERCREIIHGLDEADGVVSGLSQEPRGTLRVSVPTNFASLHLAQMASRFMQVYPEVKIEMMCSDRYVDLVDEGYDLAVRIGEISNTDLIARQLARCRHVIVASPEYLVKNPAPETPDELKHHACLVYTYTAGGIWPFEKDGKDCSVKVEGAFRSNSPELLTKAAISGMGVTMMPSFMASDAIRRGELQMVLESYSCLNIPINVVYASRKFLPAKIRVFIDYLKEHISEPPYWDYFLSVRS